MLHLQKRQIQNPEEIEPKHDDQDSADTANKVLMGNQELTQEACRRPEGDEDR
jgi:hypothetical protein